MTAVQNVVAKALAPASVSKVELIQVQWRWRELSLYVFRGRRGKWAV